MGFLVLDGLDIPLGLGFPGPRPPLIFLDEDFNRLFFPIVYVGFVAAQLGCDQMRGKKVWLGRELYCGEAAWWIIAAA